VNVTRGATIEVTLPENPTTGYRWAVESIDASILQLRNSAYSMNPGVGIGGGGARTMTFHATSVGKTNLMLKLWREWEGDATAIDHFRAIVNVQ
jgi:inhibitor of cysteine peptidase